MTTSNTGRPPAFTSIEEFAKGCESYIQWVKDNPVYKTVTASYQGEISHKLIPHARPMSVYGLSAHLGIALSTLQDYGTKPIFSVVYKETRSIMTAWNIDGATSGDFRESIIARLEGLSDKQEIQSTSEIKPTTITLTAPEIEH